MPSLSSLYVDFLVMMFMLLDHLMKLFNCYHHMKSAASWNECLSLAESRCTGYVTLSLWLLSSKVYVHIFGDHFV